MMISCQNGLAAMEFKAMPVAAHLMFHAIEAMPLRSDKEECCPTNG